MSSTTSSRDRVSIVLGTKDRPAEVERVLKYMAMARGPRDEFVVVDGSAGTESMELLEESGIVDSLRHDPSIAGYAEAMKVGIEMSHGEFVHTLSDHDVLFRAGIEQAAQEMAAQPEVDILMCSGMRKGKAMSYPDNYGHSVSDVFDYGACGAFFFMRRRIFDEVGYYDDRFVQGDFEFMARCISRGLTVRSSSAYLVDHPMKAGGNISRNRGKFLKDRRIIRGMYAEFLGHKG